MKCRLIAFLCVLGAVVIAEDNLSDRVLTAIRMAESGNNPNAIGDGGKAVGVYQLHKIYVDDANRILGSRVYKYSDRTDVYKSTKIVKAVLNHYAKNYERTTGKRCTDEVVARIHNGGPYGYRKQSTIKYWNKVKSHIKR